VTFDRVRAYFADEEFWMMQLKERMKRSANMAPSLGQTVALLAEYEKARVTGVSVAKRQNKVTGTRAGAIVAKPGAAGSA
jgi:hypothetical protein